MKPLLRTMILLGCIFLVSPVLMGATQALAQAVTTGETGPPAGEILHPEGLQERERVQYIERPDFAVPFKQVAFSAPLYIPWEKAPNAGAQDEQRFAFCPHVPPDKINLHNAAWLAYFARNQYSHFTFVADVLGKAGFGRSSDVEAALWQQCGRDLYALRAAQEQGQYAGADWLDVLAAESQQPAWAIQDYRPGGCVRTWVAELLSCRARGGDGCRLPEAGVTAAGAFEQWLLQSTGDGNYVQFFSSGKFAVDDQEGSMVFAPGSTQVFWARHRTQPLILIAFRGTELRPQQRWADVLTDLKAWFTVLTFQMQGMPREQTAWGQVHRGFARAFQEVEPFLDRKLMELKDQKPEKLAIWVTGHSLGGALATLMAARLMADVQADPGLPYRLAGLYTFGSPRVGDDAFVARFNQLAAQQQVSLGRFRNGDDTVTAIPIRYDGIFLNVLYQHVRGFAHLLDKGLSFHDTQLSHLALSLGDHNMQTYYSRLQALLTSPEYAAYLTSCVP